MFGFLRGKSSELTIVLDRQDSIYAPGETVSGTIEFEPKKSLKVQGAQLKLTGMERYRYGTMSEVSDADGDSSDVRTTKWGTHEFFTQAEDFLGEATLPGGARQRYPFSFTLPAGALPTCAGDILRITWQISVKIDRRLAGDLHATADLTVRTYAPGQDAGPGEYGRSNQPDEAELSLSLPGLECVPGQQIRGELHILPHKDFSAKIRLELVRREHVPFDEGNHANKSFPLDLAGGTKLVAGQPLVLPFLVPIPPDAAPSLQAPHGSIKWVLRGILDRSLRKDAFVEQALEVYSAGGRTAV